MKKKKTISQLEKIADKLASEIVRHRDGRCLLCGKEENLQAHHFIVTRARSTRHRWDLRNLITLCYCCHMFHVHSTASLKVIDAVRESAIRNKICTEQDIEEIKADTTPIKATREFLENVIGALKCKKEVDLEGEK